MSSAGSRLIITLRRGLAGKRGTDLATIAALGLRKPGHTIDRPNTSTVRGQISKARYLLQVELKEDYLARQAAAAAKAAQREPIVVEHK